MRERQKETHRAFANAEDDVLPTAPKPTPTARPSTMHNREHIRVIYYIYGNVR